MLLEISAKKENRMELETVKKIIISILNLKPNGLYADKLNGEFQRDAGCNIPWSKFGYTSLLNFLENELSDNIRIDNENRWNIILYPIANEKSGHVLKLKERENEPRESRRYTTQR